MVDVEENASEEGGDESANEDEDEDKVNDEQEDDEQEDDEEGRGGDGRVEEEQIVSENAEEDDAVSEHDSEKEIESRLRGVKLSDDSSTDPESDLELPENRNFKAHRDTAPNSKPHKPVQKVFDETSIKERVARSLRSQGNKQRKHNGNRNDLKGREKRRERNIAKHGSKGDGSILD